MNKLKKQLCFFIIGILSLFFFTTVSVSANQKDAWKVKSAKTPTITILNNIVHNNDSKKLFGFNINYRIFQNQLWDKNSHQLKPTIGDYLEPFQGAIYRYPGGLVANSFHWEEAIGDVEARKGQSTYFDSSLVPVSFGIDEYLQFVQERNGTPWYVLNIYGLDLQYPMKMGEEVGVVNSNSELIKYLVSKSEGQSEPLYLQLGNELDRAKYQWSPEEYATRSKAVIDKTTALDEFKDIQFVSSLRDFNWTYRRDKIDLPKSTAKDYMTKVLDGLDGTVADYSLHHYYDGDRLDGKSWTLPFWLRMMVRGFDEYREIENRDANVWITEHGRQPMSNNPGKDKSYQSTSNLSAAISTADYLIAIGQFKEIKGAVWHGLNAGPWQLFDYSVKHNDLRPRPMYWGLRVLRMLEMDNVLETYTSSPNISKYKGGYDIRSISYIDNDQNKLGLRVVNRATVEQEVRVSFDEFSDQHVMLKHYSISIPEGQSPEKEDAAIIVDLEPKEIKARFNNSGAIYITLPASSISSIEMTKI